MTDFFEFIEQILKDFPMHIDIGYSKIADWTITIVKKGCASDYPQSEKIGEDVLICFVQNPDMKLAFAIAQCELKQWLLDNEGGY